MKQKLTLSLCAICISVILNLSCQKELSCEDCQNGNIAENRAPVANAGADQAITIPIDSVLLDGNLSFDPDGTIVYYQWKQIAGPGSANIFSPQSVQTIVDALVEGVYEFEIKITDNGGLTSKDTVWVSVNRIVTNVCNNTNRPNVSTQLIPIGFISEPRIGMSVAFAGNKILFAGGSISLGQYSSRVDIYDISNNNWSTAELCAGRMNMAAISAGNKIFFGGGEHGGGPVDSVDIYDALTNNWTVSHLSAARSLIAAATVGNKVIFAGGDPDLGPMDGAKVVDIYDLTNNTWSIASLSESKRNGHSAVTINNKIYIAGGEAWMDYFIDVFCTKRIDIYDNATNSWSSSLLNQGKVYHAGLAVNGKIYWAGGGTGTFPSVTTTCSVQILDINTGSISIQQLSEPTNYRGHNAGIKNGKIIFMGQQQPQTNKFDIYDITTNTWSIGILPVIITDATIISVNNTVYVAGGMINGTLSNRVWKLEF